MTKHGKKKLAALIKLARTDFISYVLLFNNPQTSDFCMSKLHRFLARKVQKVVDGDTSPLQAVSVPPQHGKSTILCKEAMSWIMGRDPGIKVAITGHRYDLMVRFSMEVKDRTQHPLYKLVFPAAGSPLSGRDRAGEWELHNGSSLIAKSAGSKLTGDRVDFLVVDDAHAGRAEAESETQRNRVRDWYFADCVSRLAPGAKVFMIGTRWHPKDLIGRISDPDYVNTLKDSGHADMVFKITNLPALARKGDPLGRKPGEALFPEVRNRKWLLGVLASIPIYEWRSQYQGNPQSITEGQTDVSKLKRIKQEQVPIQLPRIRGWDLALTEKQTSDFSVGALCAYDRETEDFYIVHLFRKKLSWSKLKPKLLALARRDKKQFNANRMGVEAVGGFEIGLQELRTALSGEVKIEKRNPGKGGKLMRAQDWLNALEAGKIFLCRGDWNKSFIDELTEFPEGEHDDQIDAISIAWESLVRKQKLLYA